MNKDERLGANLRALFERVDKQTDISIYFSIPVGGKEPEALVFVRPLFLKRGKDLDEVMERILNRLNGEWV